MIFYDTKFIYDGVKSETMDIHLISVNDEMTGNFGVTQQVKEEKLTGIDTPFKYGIERQSIPTYKMTFARLDKKTGDPLPFTKNEREKVINWLCRRRDYAEFISYDNLNITYYVVFESFERKDFSYEMGYVTANVKFNSPYGYINGNTSITNYGTSKKFIIENKSNVCNEIKPVLTFQLLETNTNITIKNLTLGQEMTFQQLPQGIKATIYNDYKFIDCDYNIYNNFNRGWISLIYGENEIEIVGKAKVNFDVTYPMAY